MKKENHGGAPETSETRPKVVARDGRFRRLKDVSHLRRGPYIYLEKSTNGTLLLLAQKLGLRLLAVAKKIKKRALVVSYFREEGATRRRALLLLGWILQWRGVEVVEVVEPSFAALLAGAAGDVRRDERPVSRSELVDELAQHGVFLGEPGTPDGREPYGLPSLRAVRRTPNGDSARARRRQMAAHVVPRLIPVAQDGFAEHRVLLLGPGHHRHHRHGQFLKLLLMSWG